MPNHQRICTVLLKLITRPLDRNHRYITFTLIICFLLFLFFRSKNEDFGGFMDTKFVSNSKFKSFTSQLPYLPETELIISNLYDTIKFHFNPIEPPIRKIDKNDKEPVKVFIVPHSHNDPGWMFTFFGYYDIYTKNIFYNAANYLDSHKNMRFIYAEISFVDLFFSRENNGTLELFKKQIKNGQLEIVTGGWVQPDEANSLLFSLVMQLIEGHEWLNNHIGVIPKNHWSIDPFGHSPVMAYLVQLAGLKNGVLNRLHYELLKRFGDEQTLEFDWRPSFLKSNEKDFRTHIMPYGHYDSARSCGPDFSVCCRLDFIRTAQTCYKEFGSKTIQKMESETLTEMANSLAEQVKLKSALYKHKSVFLQIGEDFRYTDSKEFPAQEENFQAIFNYFDFHPELGVKAQFGTLNDYFESVAKSPKFDVPTLSGDFFTYSDRDDHYWSGFYTSRPYFKQLDRTLQQFVRAADIIFTLTGMAQKMSTKSKEAFPMLVQARRDLSLFQHHDGVTGTSQPEVMVDYGERMVNGIISSKLIIENAIKDLTGIQKAHYIEASNRLKVVKESAADGAINLIVFNQLTQPIEEIICLKTTTQLKALLASDLKVAILQQINPVYELKGGKLVKLNDKQELCFVAKINGLSIETYKLRKSISKKLKSEVIKPKNDQFAIKSKFIVANFDSKTGFLQSIKRNENNVEYKTQLEFISYGARPRGTKKTTGADSVSGAYLFLPDGKAKTLNATINELLIIKGPIRSYVYLYLKNEFSLLQRLTLNYNEDALRINNLLDLRKTDDKINIEIGMELKTDLQLNQFYTDLNGFELTRRKRYDSLPTHAQFYPMPSAALVQNDNYRISLLSRQPHGVGSILDGQIQVMLDRKLNQNDDRGELQPMVDNLPTESEFVLLIEPFKVKQKSSKNLIAYHSMKAHNYLLKMHNFPLTVLSPNEVVHQQSFLTKPLSCDVHLLALRTSTSPTNFEIKKPKYPPVSSLNSTAMILQRLGIETSLGVPRFCSTFEKKIKPAKLLSVSSKRLSNVSLTMLYDYEKLELNQEVELKPMQLSTFKLDF